MNANILHKFLLRIKVKIYTSAALVSDYACSAWESYREKTIWTVVCPGNAGMFYRSQSCQSKKQKSCNLDGRQEGVTGLLNISNLERWKGWKNWQNFQKNCSTNYCDLHNEVWQLLNSSFHAPISIPQFIILSSVHQYLKQRAFWTIFICVRKLHSTRITLSYSCSNRKTLWGAYLELPRLSVILFWCIGYLYQVPIRIP